MEQIKENIVVIGGGITGLTTAFYLQKEVIEKQLPFHIILIEASTRLGGKVQTVYKDGFTIERGPDSWLSSKKAMATLANDVGVEMVYSLPTKSLICARNNLYKMPGGAIYGIPTEILPFAISGLISPVGKLRAGMDLFISKTKVSDNDIAMGPFFRRRLGNEMVDNLIEPLISGIYASDLEKMSTMATFPDLLIKEQKYGSLILGMKLGRKAKQPKPVSESVNSPKPKGMFQTARSGLQSLINSLEKSLTSVEIIKGNRVRKIISKNGYQIQLSDQRNISAKSIVVTTEHQTIPQLFPDKKFLQFFKDMPNNSIANVVMAYPVSAIEKDVEAASILISRASDYHVTAISWIHKKWSHTVPSEMALIRAHVGKPGNGYQAIIDLPDEELEEIVLKDIGRHITLNGKPLFTVVNRWHDAMPQYMVGHKARLTEMQENVAKQLPGIFFAGAAHEGIGIPDCVEQGMKAVGSVIKWITRDL